MKKDILFVVVQFLLFALYFMGWDFFDFSFPVWVDYVAIVFVVIGLIIVSFGILNMNDEFSILSSSKKRSTVLLNGIYRYVRNPIYAGILLSLIAYSFFTASLLKMLIAMLLGVVFYFQTNREEQVLIQRFSSYKGYVINTGRFFPKRKHRTS